MQGTNRKNLTQINNYLFFLFKTEVKNVVYMLLNPEADQRPTLKQVLQHPWFSMEV